MVDPSEAQDPRDGADPPAAEAVDPTPDAPIEADAAATSPAAAPDQPTSSQEPEPAPMPPEPEAEPKPAADERPARKKKSAQTAATEVSPPVPTVASTLEAPARGGDTMEGEGGEWELLLSKLGGWWASGNLQQQLTGLRQPLTVLAALIGLLLILRVYRSVLGAIDSLPLVPGLLELVGVIWLLRYGLPRLLRRREREQLLSGLEKRRQNFLG